MPIENELNLTNVRFPYGVTFRRVEAWDGNYLFICNDCAKVGVSWNYTISRTEMETFRYPEGRGHLFSSLYKHAKLHNPLCKRLEEIILARVPIYKVEYNVDGHSHSFYSNGDDMQLPTVEEIKKKKKPKRMIRLR